MTRTALSLPGAPGAAASWWYADAIAGDDRGAARCPPLAGEQRADVAIVGGGYTGLWAALALKARRPELRIVVLEAWRCGAGASGKNGGKVSGYWTSLAGLADALGADGALALARLASRAQDELRRWCLAPGRDVWWREAGHVRVATTSAQEAKIAAVAEAARRLGAADAVRPLSPAEVQARCASPVFRAGILVEEGATVHPARLVRALRDAALDAGVSIHEGTPVAMVDHGTPCVVVTAHGRVLAGDVVLATNAGLAALPHLAPHLCVFSSYALMTDADPQALVRQGWNGDEAYSDARMFLHYFRRTSDGRVLMGSGSGPIAPAGRAHDSATTADRASIDRTTRGLRRLLPALAGTGVAAAWGGAIDVSSDRLPFVGTLPGSRVHYACGYSGHGVNATYLGGQCLASRVLGERDAWSESALCTRTVPRLPPEPLRTLGGRAIRWGILRCEEAAESGRSGPWVARALAQVPARFGLRIGTR